MDINIKTAEYKAITAAQAKQLMCSISCYTVVVDVRREDEFRLGHIKGAINIPLGQLEQQAKLLLPDTSQEIILYCRTGSRSFEAANILLSLGYQKVYDLGSISDWCCELEK